MKRKKASSAKKSRRRTAVRKTPKPRERGRSIPECTKRQEAKEALLVKLADDMAVISHGGFRMPNGKIIYLRRSRGIPLPQTDPAELARKLAASDDWRKIFANEILLLLEMFHRQGFHEAAPDAWSWCRKYKLSVPDWVRDAPEKSNRQGQPTLYSKWIQLRKDFIRFAAVDESARLIALEKKQPGYRRNSLLTNDRLVRAKALLAGPWAKFNADTPDDSSTRGVRKSVEKLSTKRMDFYINTNMLMTVIFQFHAPNLYKLLL
jgi:hypothetical protein